MSKASTAAYNFLLTAPYLKYSGFNVTPEWKYVMDITPGTSLLFNPNNPAESFQISNKDQVAQDELQSYLEIHQSGGAWRVSPGELTQYYPSGTGYAGSALDIATTSASGKIYDAAQAERDAYEAARADRPDATPESGRTSTSTQTSQVQGTPIDYSGAVIGGYKGQNIYAGTQEQIQAQMRLIDSGGTNQAGSAPVGTSSTGIQSGGTQTGSSNPGTQATAYDTGNPELNNLLGKMDEYLQSILAQGKQINPNLEIEPKLLKQFLAQAEAEIEPYYASQIKNIKDDLASNLDLIQKQYEAEKQNAEVNFKQSVLASREAASGFGTVFSGKRMEDEQIYQGQQQRALDLNAETYQNNVNSSLRNTAGTIGSRNLAGLSTPVFGAPTANLNNTPGFSTGRTLSSLVPQDITGSLEREQMTAIQTRSSELENAERQSRALTFYS